MSDVLESLQGVCTLGSEQLQKRERSHDRHAVDGIDLKLMNAEYASIKGVGRLPYI